MIREYDANDIPSICIIDFLAPWCGPCRMTSTYLEQFSEKHPEVEILKVNVDEMPEVAEQYDVISLPTLLGLKDGNVEWKHVGLMTVKQLEDTL